MVKLHFVIQITVLALPLLFKGKFMPFVVNLKLLLPGPFPRNKSFVPDKLTAAVGVKIKSVGNRGFSWFWLSAFLFLTVFSSSQGMAFTTPKASFDVNKMGDMSDFDPNRPVIPSGDTIKIAVVAAFSGPAALNGQLFFLYVQWAAHDINKRGGILVDGKKKLVQVIKADHMGKADQATRICERMALEERVHVFWGTTGSHLMKIINQTAEKYKIIAQCSPSLSDELYDATNFTRYSFLTAFSTDQIGRAFAYYYGQIRKKERRFYIFCQDYLFGHQFADAFKRGLKLYYPEATVVGEDYHKLFLMDFAPYLTKIKGSGAEVIYTGDWAPDGSNLLKQARKMGITLPFAQIYANDPNTLHDVGVEGSRGLVEVSQYGTDEPIFKTPAQIKFYKIWNELWKNKWRAPYNTMLYQHPIGNTGACIQQTYWLLSVMERARSTDPEQIIKLWEGDSYQYVNGDVVKMRACDHKAIMDLAIYEYVPPEQQKRSMTIPPYYWFAGSSAVGPIYKIPADKVLPLMDHNLDRCKGKSGWGE